MIKVTRKKNCDKKKCDEQVLFTLIFIVISWYVTRNIISTDTCFEYEIRKNRFKGRFKLSSQKMHFCLKMEKFWSHFESHGTFKFWYNAHLFNQKFRIVYVIYELRMILSKRVSLVPVQDAISKISNRQWFFVIFWINRIVGQLLT